MTSEQQERTTNIVQKIAQPFRITLTRGQRGNYGWTIEVHAKDRLTALYELDQINDYLYGRYVQSQQRTGTLQPSSSEDLHNRIEQRIENVRRAAEKGPFRSE